jgi:hypothetical protein
MARFECVFWGSSKHIWSYFCPHQISPEQKSAQLPPIFFPTGADLSGANLSNADLRKADLREVDLSDAKLNGAKLNGGSARRAGTPPVPTPEETRAEAALRPGPSSCPNSQKYLERPSEKGYEQHCQREFGWHTAGCIDTDLPAGRRNFGQSQTSPSSRSRMCIMRCGSRSLKPTVGSRKWTEKPHFGDPPG